MFHSTLKLLQKAQRGRYAVPHFNINNMEIVQGVTRAAATLRSPVILATSEGSLQYAGMNYLYSLAQTASEVTPIPIALHLDHGQNEEVVRKAILIGYSSVMIDASHEPFERNVQKTKRIVQLAHRKDIAVEAELGTIGGAEDTVRERKIQYTDPNTAQEFVERTDCDFLAVAIGTSHGAYKFAGKPSLQHNILSQIRRRVQVPLVLHGASAVPRKIVVLAEKYGASLQGVRGIPDAQIKKAIANGVTKINTDTDLRLAFDAAVRKALNNSPRDVDPRHILGPARDLIQHVAEQRIRLFGSAGKAS
ncbi:class II fructose-1,6-bisphosphate aldolase [Candidatus Woesearchaeota archaeon]|nr:class II fructose-1,6-bisphosphate aldolase [Candidatus Woesearchaeota archaeon]